MCNTPDCDRPIVRYEWCDFCQLDREAAGLPLWSDTNLPLSEVTKYGIIYVIEFVSGRIKVGRSHSEQRLTTHRDLALRYGNPVARLWHRKVSDQFTSEQELLLLLPEPAVGKEWFDGLTFARVVALAESTVR